MSSSKKKKKPKNTPGLNIIESINIMSWYMIEGSKPGEKKKNNSKHNKKENPPSSVHFYV